VSTESTTEWGGNRPSDDTTLLEHMFDRQALVPRNFGCRSPIAGTRPVPPCAIPGVAGGVCSLQPTPSCRRLRDVASDTEAAGNARAHSRWRLAAAVAGGLTLFAGLVWAGVIVSGHSQPTAAPSQRTIRPTPSATPAGQASQLADDTGFCIDASNNRTHPAPVRAATAWGVTRAAVERGLVRDVRSLNGWWRSRYKAKSPAHVNEEAQATTATFLHLGWRLPVEHALVAPMVQVRHAPDGWQLQAVGFAYCDQSILNLVRVSRG